MAKAKVIFRPVRIAEGDWNILAECPGAEPVHITFPIAVFQIASAIGQALLECCFGSPLEDFSAYASQN